MNIAKIIEHLKQLLLQFKKVIDSDNKITFERPDFSDKGPRNKWDKTLIFENQILKVKT